MSVMSSVLRRHGATLVERDGRLVAAHYGSPAGEAAVCRSAVGLAERSDRATLAVRGPEDGIAAALARLALLEGRAWSQHPWRGRALVRCEGAAFAACRAALLAAGDVSADDVSERYAAVQLIGPHARDVLAAAAIDRDTEPLLVLEAPESVELITPRPLGPALWNRLIDAGQPFGIACVGLDALEHIAVSSGLRRRQEAHRRAPSLTG